MFPNSLSALNSLYYSSRNLVFFSLTYFPCTFPISEADSVYMYGFHMHSIKMWVKNDKYFQSK